MNVSESSMLKIFASSTDRMGTKLFFEFMVESAREYGIAGVTVLRGVMGYGASSTISSSKFWELTEKLPVVIEMVDEHQKLLGFYQKVKPEIERTTKGCMVCLTPVTVLLSKPGTKTGKS